MKLGIHLETEGGRRRNLEINGTVRINDINKLMFKKKLM